MISEEYTKNRQISINLNHSAKSLSFFNPINVISYRGKKLNEIKNGQLSELTQNMLVKDGNPATSLIIENFPELTGADFLYTRDFGKLPNNRLVILRRYANPVGDVLPKGVPVVSKLVSWLPRDTTQIIPELKLSSNFTSVKLEDFSFKKSFSVGNEKTNAEFDLQTTGLILKRYLNIDVKVPKRTLSETVLGPTDFVESMRVRTLGQTTDIKFNYNFYYRMKYYQGIDPKLALIDALTNVTLMAISNLGFVINAKTGKSIEEKINKIYLSDGVSDVVKTIIDDTVNGLKNIVTNFVENPKDFKGLKDNLDSGSLDALFKTKTIRKTIKNLWYINTFLSGSATSYWHLTVGNPFNPIISWGNLVLDDLTIKFSNTLSIDDFPDGFDVSVSLSPARALSASEIIKKFNTPMTISTKTEYTVESPIEKPSEEPTLMHIDKAQIKETLDNFYDS